MKILPIIITVIITVVAVIVIQAYVLKNSDFDDNNLKNKDNFITNEGFINDLYQDLDLNDSKQIFRYVFSRLGDEAVIYPTENYYYFGFPTKGRMILGALSLFASNRDNGIMDIGYSERIDKLRQTQINFQPVGGAGKFTAKDGVIIKKINDFNYSVTFEGKTVIFRLNDIGITPPSTLSKNETFVGPSFDESGLKFFLIFNNTEQKLFWVLNEDTYVPENFTSYTDDIVIGDRTEFAFYVDKVNKNRKILMGVEGLNVLQNGWYDGPFDQMPDNYVYTGQIEVGKYIEASYPDIAGMIDKYGNYIGEEGARVAVAPYLVYFSKEDLASTVASCKSEERFYSCMTQQVFVVPESFYGMASIPLMPNETISNETILNETVFHETISSNISIK